MVSYTICLYLSISLSFYRDKDGILYNLSLPLCLSTETETRMVSYAISLYLSIFLQRRRQGRYPGQSLPLSIPLSLSFYRDRDKDDNLYNLSISFYLCTGTRMVSYTICLYLSISLSFYRDKDGILYNLSLPLYLSTETETRMASWTISLYLSLFLQRRRQGRYPGQSLSTSLSFYRDGDKGDILDNLSLPLSLSTETETRAISWTISSRGWSSMPITWRRWWKKGRLTTSRRRRKQRSCFITCCPSKWRGKETTC